jgi:hypothetical protein
MRRVNRRWKLESGSWQLVSFVPTSCVRLGVVNHSKAYDCFDA